MHIFIVYPTKTYETTVIIWKSYDNMSYMYMYNDQLFEKPYSGLQNTFTISL